MAQRVVNFRGGEQIVVPFSLEKITTSHNPRKPVRRLQRQGIVPIQFLHDYALSDDVEKNREYVSKMSQEPEILSLARSISRLGQAQPIVLRTFRAKIGKDKEENNLYEVRGGVAAGERRVLSCGLLEAVRRLAVAEGKKPGETVTVGDEVFTLASKEKPWDLKKPWEVDAICLDKISVEDAAEIGWDENAQRLDMTDIDWGVKFDSLLRRYNPDTQKPWTIQEVASKYGKNYHWVRGRAALPYLPQELQDQIEDGKANITQACILALQYKAAAVAKQAAANVEGQPAIPTPELGEGEEAPPTVITPAPEVPTPPAPTPPAPTPPAPTPGKPLGTSLPGRKPRRATIALHLVQEKFDATPEANVERRQALAECMGMTLEEAGRESIARKEVVEQKKALAAERAARNPAA